MVNSQFSVSWDAYQKSICKGLSALQQNGEFVDMTITADGHHVRVHQMVISLVSPYIKDLIKSAQCPHPIIFLNRVSYQTLQSILEYAYTGEVLVPQDRLGEFLEACRALHIKGLENTLKIAETTGGKIYSQYPAQQTKDNSMESHNTSTSCDQSFDVLDTEDHFEIDHSDEDDRTEVQSARDHLVKQNNTAAKPLTLQYSVSTQGFLQAVINRYIYSLRHTRKNSERFWRCVNQQKSACPAIVATKDGQVLERTGAHNHPFHDKQIMKRVQNDIMFPTLSEAEYAGEKKRKTIKENRGREKEKRHEIP